MCLCCVIVCVVCVYLRAHARYVVCVLCVVVVCVCICAHTYGVCDVCGVCVGGVHLRTHGVWGV